MQSEQPTARWRRWALVILGCFVFLTVGMLVSIQMVGGIDHLTGGTTKTETRVVSVTEGDRQCGRKGDPWVVTYGWTAGGQQLTVEDETCRDEPPPAGERAYYWIDEDNEPAGTLSPGLAWIMAAGLDLTAFVIVGGCFLFLRRTVRKLRSRPA